MAGLALGALGIVYGDIGTSPLYSLRESFHHHGLPVEPTQIYGVASTVFWALIVVVAVKYLTFVMKADNRGEGGILALTALVMPRPRVDAAGIRRDLTPQGIAAGVIALGVFGTALLYGDGLITPAISVLSAVEGFEVATSAFKDWVVPVSVVILVVLFAVQKRGTAGIAKIFGPIMALWFTVIAVLGVSHIVREPSVFRALSPTYAAAWFFDSPGRTFLTLGSIILVVTGGEALYADMGHFGRKPIMLSWYGLVFPALVLCYLGQAALLSQDPDAVESPFYRLAPNWGVTPLAVLATIATVIASQALISGAFSLTVQAVQLDYLPRLAIKHTSAEHIGQVYVPLVNWLLMIGCVALVVGFRTSTALAGAYGIAVAGTMMITTLLFYRVVRDRYGWSEAKSLAVCLPLLGVDLGFFIANLPKIPHGGWFPLVIALGLVVQMTTWRRGRQIVAGRLRRAEIPIADMVTRVVRDGVHRVPGTAVYMFKDAGATPTALLVNLEHQSVLHERVLLLSIHVAEVPQVRNKERIALEELGHGFFQMVLSVGFMEDSDVVTALRHVSLDGEPVDPMGVTYFLGDEMVISTALKSMHPWREKLFVLLDRGADNASRFFNLPPDRVVTVGTQVEI